MTQTKQPPANPVRFIPFLVPVVDEGFAREFVIFANLLTQSWSGGVANFGHTASLSFALPSGLSFTSESGVFLTGAVTSVPEPTTLALFAAGLASLGLLRRSRRQTDLPDMKPNEHDALWRLSLDQIGPSPRRR